MIQTPILDREMKTTKENLPQSSYLSGKKSPKGSANWKDRLEGQKDSESLSLVDLFIGDEGAYEVAKFLKYNKDFVSLHLRGNNISAAGFETICQALKGATRIKTISAEWNNVGSDISGLVALHQLLKANTTIEIVDLKNNRLGPSAARVIADIIRDSSSVKKLDLRWNEIGEEGGEEILDALKETKKRVVIDLNGNKLNEETLAQVNEYVSEAAYSHRSLLEGKSESNRAKLYSPPTKELTTNYYSSNAGTSHVQGVVSPKYNTTYQSKYQSNYGANSEPGYQSGQRVKENGRNETKYISQFDRNNLVTGTIPASPEFQTEKRSYNVNGGSSLHKYEHNIKHEDTTEALKSSGVAQGNAETRKFYYDTKVDVPSRTSYEVRHETTRRYEPQTLASQLLQEKEGASSKYQRNYNIETGVSKVDFAQTQLKRSSMNVNQDNMTRDSVVSQTIDAHNLKVGKLISELERALEKERNRANDAENKLNTVLNEFQIVSAIKDDTEKKYSQLIENLKRTDIEFHNLKVNFENISHENADFKSEINMLKEEVSRLEKHNSRKVAEIEEKYKYQLKNLESQNHSLQGDYDNLNNQLLEVKRDFDYRNRQYEEQIEEFTKLNDELSNELSSQIEYIEKLKADHERDLKRAADKAREDERSKAQIVIDELEGELHKLKSLNDSLNRKDAEMLKDLQNYEKQIRDQHINFGNELSRVGGEIDRYRSEVNQANIVIQKQSSEISAKDGTIAQLESETERLRSEIQRLADMQVSQIDNFKREYEVEKRRFEENERQLILKIEEIERRLVESQNETIKVTREYDRLVEIMQGNVSRVIQDTFSTHKNTSEIRHIEHKISTPAKFYSEDRSGISSRIYGNVERKYL